MKYSLPITIFFSTPRVKYFQTQGESFINCPKIVRQIGGFISHQVNCAGKWGKLQSCSQDSKFDLNLTARTTQISN